MKILEGKTALITGGGSGIGRAAAALFAKEGAIVIVANRRVDKGEETARLIEQQGGRAVFFQTDVSRKDEVERLIDRIVKSYGELHCAFNCGGIDGKPDLLVDSSEADFHEIIDINLKGTYLLLKYEIRQMLGRKRGSIVNMSSVMGSHGSKARAIYSASRHAIEGLTKTASIEYAKSGIRINAIAPGSIRTDIYYRSVRNNPEKERYYQSIIPMGRIGEPEEVARAALWLCSDDSSYVTGHVLAVDGGITT